MWGFVSEFLRSCQSSVSLTTPCRLAAALNLGPIPSIASPSSCGPGRQEQEEEVEEAEAEPVELNSGGTALGWSRIAAKCFQAYKQFLKGGSARFGGFGEVFCEVGRTTASDPGKDEVLKIQRNPGR